MKWLYHCCLLATLLVLASCQLTPLQGEQVGAIVRETVATVDRNDDGIVSNRELKDSKNNTELWLAVILGAIGLVTGGAGVAKANSANKLATKVEAETDEQWEELKRVQQQPPLAPQ